ncbi:MAG TPA: hypothetical protein VMG12_23505 [Polyangiaceae bacterium]|nr:hypothetical protein [Polyangiaceae bacterium]
MERNRARPAVGAVLAIVLGASEGLAQSQAQPQSPCDTERAVALDIVAAGGGSTSSERLARTVSAELAASRVAVCAAPARPSSSLRVEVRETLPAWQHAWLRFESTVAPPLERELDVSSLPEEARALAIASATDELVRSGFATLASGATASTATAASPADATASSPPAPVAVDRRPPEVPPSPPSEPFERTAPFELGVAGAGSSYFGQREAVEGDIALRYWLSPRLPLTASVGLARRLWRPTDRGAVQLDADWHAALGAGWSLWGEPGGFELLGEGGLQLTRVRFDLDPSSFEPQTGQLALVDDRAWALASRLGLEARARLGVAGVSLALDGIIPLVPARPFDGGAVTAEGVVAQAPAWLDTFGVRLQASVWFPL